MAATVDITGALNPVECGVRLGWRIVEVYQAPPPYLDQDDGVDPLPPRLPDKEHLGEYARGKMLIGEIEHDLAVLIDAAGLQLDVVAQIAQLKNEPVRPETVQTELIKVSFALADALAAAAPMLRKALRLGHLLANVVTKPDVADFAGFKGRALADLAEARDRLGELGDVLPNRTSKIVSDSAKRWIELFESAQTPAEVDLGALDVQGRIWRQLLCGQRAPDQFLQPEDYEAAGGELLRGFGGIIRGFLRRSWWLVVFALAVIVVGTIAIVGLIPGGPAQVATLLVAGAGALGISWKTLSATVGAAIARSTDELWAAEVEIATVDAVTQLQPRSRRTRTRAPASRLGA